MQKSRLAIIVALAVVFAMCIGTATAAAASLSDLRNQISEKEKELAEGKAQEESHCPRKNRCTENSAAQMRLSNHGAHGA